MARDVIFYVGDRDEIRLKWSTQKSLFWTASPNPGWRKNCKLQPRGDKKHLFSRKETDISIDTDCQHFSRSKPTKLSLGLEKHCGYIKSFYLKHTFYFQVQNFFFFFWSLKYNGEALPEWQGISHRNRWQSSDSNPGLLEALVRWGTWSGNFQAGPLHPGATGRRSTAYSCDHKNLWDMESTSEWDQ